jgi:hypothetical protein
LKPVKKFADRKVVVGRIWQAIQRLGADGTASTVAEPKAQPKPEAVAAPEVVAVCAPEPATEIPLVVATEINAPVAEAMQETSVHEVPVAAEVATVPPRSPMLRRGSHRDQGRYSRERAR